MQASVRPVTEGDAKTLDIIAGWMYGWWGTAQGYSMEAVRCYVRNSAMSARLPRTFGLFLGDEPIGTYQLRLDDLFVRPDIYPWLANVYIHTPYRGKGYGRAMLNSVRENAALCLPFEELYLYTVHRGLYEKFGWELVEEIDTHLAGHRMQLLYRLDIAGSPRASSIC